MRLVLITTLLLSVGILSFAQDSGIQPWQNCNPKVSDEEAELLNKLFPVGSYDFKNKTVAFADNSSVGGGDSRRNIHLATKKEFYNFITKKKDVKYEFIMFTPELKSLTYGFDVLAIASTPKLKPLSEKKTNRFITSIGYRELNYPDNISSVGNDTSEALNDNEVAFLNSLFRYSYSPVDFKNKKVAFAYCDGTIISKNEYITRVKAHLENDFLYPTDHISKFSEQEKIETGGYDYAIVIHCKRVYLYKIINSLKAKTQ